MARPGERRVRFRGRSIGVRPGETLAQALGRHGVVLRQRSIRYHRPRAPFCGIGLCTQCLVRVDGTPNVRACRLLPSEGATIETENAWPSPSFDLLGLLDPLFPNGVDTLRGFRWPAWAAPAYQAVVRRLAAYGRLPDPRPRPPPPPPIRRETTTLLIGAGSAGRAALAPLASAGPTVVIERGPGEVGEAGATVLDRTTAIFLPPPRKDDDRPFELLAVRDDGAGVIVLAERVVVAVGGYDASLAFPGSDRPGVMTADGVLSLVGTERAPGFRKAVVVGSGERALALLERFGPFVAAVVAPGPVGPEVARVASELGVPIFPRTLLLGASGRSRVRSVRLAPRGGGSPFTLSADALLLGHRRLPNPQLLFQAGAKMEWRSGTGAYYPVLSDRLETSVPGLFAIGESAGFVGEAAALSGARVGTGGDLGPPLPRVPSDGPDELTGYYRELLARPRPRGKWVVCACEDVLMDEIADASHRGFTGIEVTKRFTGVGTGLCQGRYCLPDAVLVLSVLEGRSPPEVGYITQRPPVVPARLDALAGIPGPDGSEAE